MRFSQFVLLGFFPSVLLAQQTFESPDFDITAALLDNGVNVSDIPDPVDLSKRTSSGSCSVAVSLTCLLALSLFRYGTNHDSSVALLNASLVMRWSKLKKRQATA
jgi:hypothetical protein